PSYEVIEETGPEHQKNFVVGVFVQKREWGRGKGASKKAAEQAGARAALAPRMAERGDGEDAPTKPVSGNASGAAD
ncbi:MAG TPA: putative dsRNA-binding protein, partial [Fibrobacteria bacterium]|nr:putative dsRNA-binding protein [Fibrobacteria bacterium]